MKKNGFSLVEVIIAMLLFSIGGLAAAGMVNSAAGSLDLARAYTNMTCLASGRMEEFLAAPFDQLKDQDGDGTAGLDNIGDQADGQELTGRYQLSWNFANNTPMENTTTICVIVETRSLMRGGLKRTVTFSAVNSSP